MKILLLEDDKVIAEQIIEYFVRKNHEITHFLDGESLLESNKILETDVCIFDINVPKLNGLETLKTIRELKINKPYHLDAQKYLSDGKTANTKGKLRIGLQVVYLIRKGQKQISKPTEYQGRH